MLGALQFRRRYDGGAWLSKISTLLPDAGISSEARESGIGLDGASYDPAKASCFRAGVDLGGMVLGQWFY
jgi:hypothetical protein